MQRRAFLAASLIPPLLALPLGADAHTARILSLEELLGFSTYVVVGTAGEKHSVWEDLPSGRRIVTYTRLTVERVVTGKASNAGGTPAPPGAELWVRTLGGAVGSIGQAVPGEAQLLYGSRSLLFLAEVSGVVVVAAMAQGHYPVVTDDKGTSRLAPSPETGLLIARPGPVLSAHERLVGTTVDEAAALVKQTRKALDEKK